MTAFLLTPAIPQMFTGSWYDSGEFVTARKAEFHDLLWKSGAPDRT